jgi:hypothetical protein
VEIVEYRDRVTCGEQAAHHSKTNEPSASSNETLHCGLIYSERENTLMFKDLRK